MQPQINTTLSYYYHPPPLFDRSKAADGRSAANFTFFLYEVSFTLLAPTKIDNGSIKLQLCFKMDKDEVRIDGFSFIEVVELAIGVIVIPCRDRSSKG